MQADNPLRSDGTSNESANEESQDTKEKLLRDIQELTSIIRQCELNANISRFKDIEHTIESHDTEEIPHLTGTKIDAQLRNDLYKFAGFHCVKASKQEFIFNFSSVKDKPKENTYAIQFFVKNGKGYLGKWVLPIAIDMNCMLNEMPIEKLMNLIPFTRRCKHSIDCYVVRQEQFLSLKAYIVRLKYCTAQSNLGYTQITLELYGVHDSEKDKYINLMIHLLYHSDGARPHKVHIDTTDRNELSKSTISRLKAWLKIFKISDLKSAFDTILAQEDFEFKWTRVEKEEEDDESLLELNDTSGSDEEGFIMQLRSGQKKALRKATRKRELQKKWNDRLKQKDSIVSRKTSKDNRSKTKVSYVERINKDPSKKAPINKSKIKLKQTKLTFQTGQNKNSSDADQTFSSESKSHKKSDENKVKLFTSTPLPKRFKNVKLRSFSIEFDNITVIETESEQVINKRAKLDDSKNSSKKSENISRKELNALTSCWVRLTRLPLSRCTKIK